MATGRWSKPVKDKTKSNAFVNYFDETNKDNLLFAKNFEFETDLDG